MLGLNAIKHSIYLAIFVIILSFTSLVWGNTEISGHLGMKFGSRLNLREITARQEKEALGVNQKNMPFHFGLDVTHKIITVNTKRLALGLRYRFAFTGGRDFDWTNSENTTGGDADDEYKFAHNRLALLVNYRFYIDQFFVGPILGIDLWKYLKFSVTNLGIGAGNSYELTSNQFLWNKITGQLGVEGGYKINENLLVKLEIGYDLSRFSDLKCKLGLSSTALTDCTQEGNNNPLEMEGNKSANTFRFDALYVTLGIGWLFG